MADMNSVNVIGRLTRDAELKTLPSGTTLCEFSVANNRGWGEHAKVHYFDVKLWGKGASAVAKYLVKGKRVGVSGEINQDRWNGSDGKAHSKLYITTFDVQLMDGGTDNQRQDREDDNYAQVDAEVVDENNEVVF